MLCATGLFVLNRPPPSPGVSGRPATLVFRDRRSKRVTRNEWRVGAGKLLPEAPLPPLTQTAGLPPARPDRRRQYLRPAGDASPDRSPHVSRPRPDRRPTAARRRPHHPAAAPAPAPGDRVP